jgi:hypothetical protein
MKRNLLTLAIAGLIGLSGMQHSSAEENHFFSTPGKKAPAADTVSKTNIKPSLTDLDVAESAVVDLWTRLPFSTRRVMFVSKKPMSYGAYEQRPSSIFAAGETLITYIEPVGYKWDNPAPSSFRFGMTIDFEVQTSEGKVLGGQKQFQNFEFNTHYRNREIFLTLTATIDGLTPGNYVLAYTVYDKFGDGAAVRTKQPFSIKTAD